MKTEFRLQQNFFSNYIEVAFIQTDGDRAWVAQPLMLNKIDEGAIIEPSFKLKKDEAQQLLDELWRNGVRPSRGDFSVGALDAKNQHLADMQKIAMLTLDAVLKK